MRQNAVSDGTTSSLQHPVKVGTPIRALYRGGPTWYDGSVSNARADGTYDILYTDGDRCVISRCAVRDFFSLNLPTLLPVLWLLCV